MISGKTFWVLLLGSYLQASMSLRSFQHVCSSNLHCMSKNRDIEAGGSKRCNTHDVLLFVFKDCHFGSSCAL